MHINENRGDAQREKTNREHFLETPMCLGHSAPDRAATHHVIRLRAACPLGTEFRGPTEIRGRPSLRSER